MGIAGINLLEKVTRGRELTFMQVELTTIVVWQKDILRMEDSGLIARFCQETPVY